MPRNDSPEIRSGLIRAGILVILGLLVEAFTLFWHHPTAFVFFAIAGIGLVLLGIVLYLWTILRAEPSVAET